MSFTYHFLFKNSLLGSGSSGWIHSARNVGVQTVKDIIEASENKTIPLEDAQRIALKVGSKYVFKEDSEDLLYLIRDPINQNPCDYITKPFSGFAKEVTIQSELKSGVLVIDGNFQRDVEFGDIVTLKKSLKDLHCLHFLK